jgi:hypothetical protein
MERAYVIKVLKNNDFLDSIIEFSDKNKIIKLIFRCGDLIISSEDQYPFFALVKLRLELEKQSSMLLCNGSRVDVYPSGSSAIGNMAYILEINTQATKLVEIFEPMTEVGKLASVSKQKEYRDHWLKCLA